MTFSLINPFQKQTTGRYPVDHRQSSNTRKVAAAGRRSVSAEQLQPIPIPVSNPRRIPIASTPVRLPVPQTEMTQPRETETSTALKDMSALGQAVFKNETARIDSLLAKLSGEAINQADKNGFSPLAVAVRYGKDFVVKQLLAHPKTDANQPNQDQRTPLILAARYGRTPILQQLLNTPRINLNARDKDGMTALDWSIRQHNQESIRLLQAAGAESAVYKRQKP
ncbi:ankyrin repeat domain-containing protein [Vampirovibrio chlorellavorus]|uniref:ankyrin repeat domain-containing protein n=1 Tax=Vampirovibrio chlorellavorus TaxID=758823 RepID=UPI0026EBB431|nr:ankyrin repeat domain-containing protein [Vampirovibrio chlorellavorus]